MVLYRSFGAYTHVFRLHIMCALPVAHYTLRVVATRHAPHIGGTRNNEKN